MIFRISSSCSHSSSMAVMGMFVMERLIQQLLAGRVRQGLAKRPGVSLHSWPLLHLQLSPPHLPIQPQYKHKTLNMSVSCISCAQTDSHHTFVLALLRNFFSGCGPPQLLPLVSPISSSHSSWFGLRCDLLLIPLSFALQTLCGESIINLQSKHFF